MKYRLLVVSLTLAFAALSYAQSTLDKALGGYFTSYRPQGQTIRNKIKLERVSVDDSLKQVKVTANAAFGEQRFTQENIQKIYNDLRALLPDSLQSYQLNVETGGWEISSLAAPGAQRTWGNIDYKGKPWVSNASRPYPISRGLANRHFSIWASHGIYYNIAEGKWKWQRPPLFATSEDFFTQTIVTPYLLPMLEKAGAVTFSPRERDLQKQEVIVDNDQGSGYEEHSMHDNFHTTEQPGFALHEGNYLDKENPFEAGTARVIETTDHAHRQSYVSYQPTLPEAGRYAVYVSYQTVKGCIDDALYTVWHKGVATNFHVNQQMGGSTWVYLGTFDFDAGYSEFNRVTVSNQSDHNGVVTTDAVRFGGGMGNIQRFGAVSNMPRALEGARYYAQWAGMPYTVYSSKEGADDYADDINVRSLMTNLLGGGSCYMPNSEGRRVPIELSLAVHSDAGHTPTGEGVYGGLTICTTGFGDSLLAAGLSRNVSQRLANDLFNNTTNDLQERFGQWTMRKIYDRNYSESRVPIVPSARTIVKVISSVILRLSECFGRLKSLSRRQRLVNSSRKMP